MAEITSKQKQEITLRNEILVDGVNVVGQSATIDSDNPENMSFSEWTNNKDLYKEHRNEIRELKAQFEDDAYEKQDELMK